MGAAASSCDIQEADVAMEQLPPAVEAMAVQVGAAAESAPKAVAADQAVSEKASRQSLLHDREYLDKREKELMKDYDSRLQSLEKKRMGVDATVSPPAALSNVPDNTLAIYKREMIVPKFYNEIQSPFLTREEMEHEFFDAFRAYHGPSSAKPLDWSNFVFEALSPSSTMKSHWHVSAQGDNAETVEAVLYHLNKWIKITKIPLYNYNLTARLGHAIQVELDASLPLGAGLQNLKSGGVRITHIADENCEFARIVGAAAADVDTLRHFAIVESVNDQPCLTRECFVAMKQDAAAKSAKLQLVVKYLQEKDCKLLWTYVAAEKVEVSTSLEPSSQSTSDELGRRPDQQPLADNARRQEQDALQRQHVLDSYATKDTSKESKSRSATSASVPNVNERASLELSQEQQALADKARRQEQDALQRQQILDSDATKGTSKESKSRSAPESVPKGNERACLVQSQPTSGELGVRPDQQAVADKARRQEQADVTKVTSKESKSRAASASAPQLPLAQVCRSAKCDADKAETSGELQQLPSNELDARSVLSLANKTGHQDSKTSQIQGSSGTTKVCRDSSATKPVKPQLSSVPESNASEGKPDVDDSCADATLSETADRRASDSKSASAEKRLAVLSTEKIVPQKQPTGVDKSLEVAETISSVSKPAEKNEKSLFDTESEDESSSAGKSAAKQGSRQFLDYNVFKRKVGPILETEFKRAGIYKLFAIGRAWHHHKLRHSSTCSDECQCAYDLPALTETVVIDYHEKEAEWTNPMNLQVEPECYPMGLTGNFARVYMPRLKEQYPQESSTSHLERLLFMWTIHRKSKKFGASCHDNCKCSKSWVSLFRAGALEGEEPVSVDSGRRSRPPNDAAAAPIPKKRKLSPSDIPTESVSQKKQMTKPNTGSNQPAAYRCAADSSSSSEPVADQKRKSLRHGDSFAPPTTNSSATTEQQPYAIDYDCRMPLGIYCVTEKKDGPQYCKVLSVCPNGTHAVDPRIQYETKILCIEPIGGQRKAIKAHTDLQLGYVEAKASGAVLRVTFINTNVTPDAVNIKSRYFARQWTIEGQWNGKCATGWDGGAKVSLQKRVYDSTVAPPWANNSESLTYKKGRLTLAKLHTCRMYDIESCPNESISETKEEKVFSGQPQRIAPQERALRKTQAKVAEKPDMSTFSLSRLSIKGLLDHLKNGFLEDDDAVKRLQQILKSEIKQERERFVRAMSETVDDPISRRRIAELDLIKKVLKISVNADCTAKEAQALGSLERLQVCVMAIDGLDIKGVMQFSKVDVTVSYVIAGKPEKLPSLPCMPYASLISFENTQPYNVNLSPTYEGEGRRFEFLVETRDRLGSPVYLGKFLVKLPELSPQGVSDKDWWDLVFEPSEGLSRARLCLRVNRVSRSDLKELAKRKRKEAQAHLDETIEWICRINDDLINWNVDQNDNLSPIGADLRLTGGTSLLHSAIHLMDTMQLSRLLHLRKEPIDDVCLNSALSLTMVSPSLTDDVYRVNIEATLDEMSDMLCSLIKTPAVEATSIASAVERKSPDDAREPLQIARLEKPGEPSNSVQPVARAEIIGTTGISQHDQDRPEPDRHVRRDDFTVLSGCPKPSAIDSSHSEVDPDELQPESDRKKRSRVWEESESEIQTPAANTDVHGRDSDSDSISPKRGERPKAGHSDWPFIHPLTECRSFKKRHICSNRHCPHMHVHRLSSADLDRALHAVKVTGMASKIRGIQPNHKNVRTERVSRSVLKVPNTTASVFWKAAFVTATDVYYAVGDELHVSDDNVCWYRKKSDAVAALAKTVVIARQARSEGHAPQGFETVAFGGYSKPTKRRKASFTVRNSAV